MRHLPAAASTCSRLSAVLVVSPKQRRSSLVERCGPLQSARTTKGGNEETDQGAVLRCTLAPSSSCTLLSSFGDNGARDRPPLAEIARRRPPFIVTDSSRARLASAAVAEIPPGRAVHFVRLARTEDRPVPAAVTVVQRPLGPGPASIVRPVADGIDRPAAPEAAAPPGVHVRYARHGLRQGRPRRRRLDRQRRASDARQLRVAAPRSREIGRRPGGGNGSSAD